MFLQELKQVALIVWMQQVEIEKSFGAVGVCDSEDEVIDAQVGKIVERVGMGSAEGAGESARADEADDKESGRKEGEDESSEADENGESGGAEHEDGTPEVQGPPNEDARGEAGKSAEEAGEAGGDHAIGAVKVLRREVANGENIVRIEDEYAVTLPAARREVEACESDAGDKEDEGAIAENSKESVLPFEIGSERMGIGGPKEDSGQSKKGRTGEREDDEDNGEQAVVPRGLMRGIKDSSTRRGVHAARGG